jgi:hypothetical protein
MGPSAAHFRWKQECGEERKDMQEVEGLYILVSPETSVGNMGWRYMGCDLSGRRSSLS